MKVNDSSDRDEASIYTNHEFYVNRSILKQTKLDEYYHVDLIGLKVYDVNNNFIGVVDGIANNNNFDYLKINLNNRLSIIPFTKKNVNKIDFRSKKLLLNNYDF